MFGPSAMSILEGNVWPDGSCALTVGQRRERTGTVRGGLRPPRSPATRRRAVYLTVKTRALSSGLVTPTSGGQLAVRRWTSMAVTGWPTPAVKLTIAPVE